LGGGQSIGQPESVHFCHSLFETCYPSDAIPECFFLDAKVRTLLMHSLTLSTILVGGYAKVVSQLQKIFEVYFVVVFPTFVFDLKIRNAPRTNPFLNQHAKLTNADHHHYCSSLHHLSYCLASTY
jgi:hypothetical protein